MNSNNFTELQHNFTDTTAALYLVKQLSQTATFQLAQQFHLDEIFDIFNSSPPSVSNYIEFVLSSLGYSEQQQKIETLLLEAYANIIKAESEVCSCA